MPNYEVEVTFDKPTSCRKSFNVAAPDRNTAIVLAGMQVLPGWRPIDIKVFEIAPSSPLRGDSRTFELSFDTERHSGDLDYEVVLTFDDDSEEKLTVHARNTLQALTKAIYNFQDHYDLACATKCKITHLFRTPATRTLVTE